MVEIFLSAQHALHQSEIESQFDGIDRIIVQNPEVFLRKKA